MLLALDIGNTNVTIGVFEGERLRATWRAETDIHKMPDEYAVVLLNLLSLEGLARSNITKAVICSVVPPLTDTFLELCQRYFHIKPLVVDVGVKTGIKVLVDNPREVGADRIADSVAAYRLYGGPVIIVDFGTATVLDAVSKDGEYLGGAIAPGIRIAAEALFARTAKLPSIELTKPRSAIGRNTVASMQSGLILGYIGLTEGLIARFKKELGENSRVVATGGFASTIASEVPPIELVNPDLTLIGLRLIHEINEK